MDHYIKNNTKEGVSSKKIMLILNNYTGNNKDTFPKFNKQQVDSLFPSSLKAQSLKIFIFPQ